jgi:predicted nucleotidyltransferase
MDNRVYEVVQKYASIVKRQYKPSKIYLYGSHAKGIHNDKSDIDVAVVFPSLSSKDYMDVFGNLFSLAANVDERIEPNLFVDDGAEDKYSMLYEVMRTGREINP